MDAIFSRTYEIRNLIGKGGMSSVYLAEHKRLHTNWAVKEVRKNQGARFDFLAESNILKRLHHPMLPRIVDIFETTENIYIVEDYVEGITLSDYLKREKHVGELEGLQWFRDLCGVLQYLHGQTPSPIIYRDMKPSNIMLQPDGSLKLIDFGIAREYKVDANADTTYIGTKGYAAPEQFGKAQSDARTDIYSLGVTMYHLLTGKSPYEPPYAFVPARQLVRSLSHGTECVLEKCIQIEPEKRYQTADALLDDLNHLYRFDRAYRKYQNAKRLRAATVVVLLAASIAMITGGNALMKQEAEAEQAKLIAQEAEQQRLAEEAERKEQQEKEETYVSLLTDADTHMQEFDYDSELEILEEAASLLPERPEAYRQRAYTLYRRGAYQDCVNEITEDLKKFPEDGTLLLTEASAYFELGEYERAADGFLQGAQLMDMDADHLRDYAVCLGRLGDFDGAEQILTQLTEQGTEPAATCYVQGEIAYAKEDYPAAESAFLEALESAENDMLLRRCYVSLGELYRDCSALARANGSPIENPATKSAALLSEAITKNALRYDTTLWEMLAMAYYESFHIDPNAPREYLRRAGECFTRVIELGVVKDYLYSNLYSIYYEQGEYKKAMQALSDYETNFPGDYMPHALRGILLISMENQKPQSERDFKAALREYETAGSMIRSEDNTSYYQQLGSLIDELKRNGW